jgi:hypothetical protein
VPYFSAISPFRQLLAPHSPLSFLLQVWLQIEPVSFTKFTNLNSLIKLNYIVFCISLHTTSQLENGCKRLVGDELGYCNLDWQRRVATGEDWYLVAPLLTPEMVLILQGLIVFFLCIWKCQFLLQNVYSRK